MLHVNVHHLAVIDYSFSSSIYGLRERHFLLSHVTKTGCNSEEKDRLRTDSTAGAGKLVFVRVQPIGPLIACGIGVVTTAHNSPTGAQVDLGQS